MSDTASSAKANKPSVQGCALWLTQVLRIWTGEWGTPAIRHAAFLTALTLICVATIFIGVPQFIKYTHDLWLFLDGGWRILHGQRPHADFFSGIGPVTYLVNALGLVLSGMRPAGLGVGTAIVGAVVGLWAYAVALRRSYPGAAALAALMLTLLAVAPYSLGERFIDTGVACIYNRYGAAILGIVVIETFRPARDRDAGFGGGISTGLAWGLLLFLKISFFCGAFPFIALALVYDRRRRDYIAGLVAGFTATALPMIWYLRFNLAPMWGDLLEMAQARHGENSRVWAIAGSYFDWMGLALLVGVVIACRCTADPDYRTGWRPRREVVFAVVVTLVGALVLFTSHQATGMPLNALMVILIAGNIPLSGIGSNTVNEAILLRGTIALLALSLAMPTAVTDFLSIGISLHDKVSGVPPAIQTFQTPRLAGIWVAGDYERSETSEYVQDIKDGMAMIQRLSAPNESVYSLDFTNPFTYALARPPAHGGAWSLHFNMGIDDRHHPSPEFAIGGADIMMEPKFPSADIHGILRIYGEYLHSHFHLVEESSRWRMYRRNP
jgi:hypothetical protein